MSRRVASWLPALIVPAAIVAGAVVMPLQAGAAVDLPDKSPAEVLLLAGSPSVSAFSGTVEQSSELGLPDLSALEGPGAAAGADVADALELLTGSHTARVFVDGSDARLQVLDRLAERDLVLTADDAWFYDSESHTATHWAVPDHGGKASRDAAAMPTPDELATAFLAKIDGTTEVTVGTDARVAGRASYELVLTPRTTDTLVGRVAIAVDAATGLPLAVEVRAREADTPAFRIAFSELSLAAPAAALFAFTPPLGSTVVEGELPTKPELHDGDTAEGRAGPTVIGDGWTSIVEIAAADVPTEVAASPLLTTATQAVAGGRVLTTTLVSVLFTDDGRVLVGSVTPQRLQDAANR